MAAHDLVVVGGGPAGLATAIVARIRGLEVLVIDRALPPIDKPCGEGLMPEGVAVLRNLGVTLDGVRSHPFRGIRFVESGNSAEARFPDVSGVGIRRTVLHGLMVERASAVGVAMRWGAAVSGLGREGVEIGGERVAARWIVAADGRESRVRRMAGFPLPRDRRRRAGLRRHYRVAPWTDFVEVHWHDRGQAYVTPVAPDEVCVAIVANEPAGRIDEMIELFPDLSRRLLSAEKISSTRGSITSSSRMARVVRGNVALVGDASGTVDAITGEGLSIAFRQSVVLADALARDDLSLYQAAHPRIGRMPRIMAKVMLFAGDRAWMRRRALHALSSQTQVFEFMLGVHVGRLSPGAVRIGAVAGFVRQLIAGA